MYKIKEKPKDFLVNEITNIKLIEKGEYSIFLLKKTNYTTENAVQTIAKKLKIPRKFISYAGNKDKIAITTQYISIKNSRMKELKLKDMELELKGYSDKPISLPLYEPAKRQMGGCHRESNKVSRGDIRALSGTGR